MRDGRNAPRERCFIERAGRAHYRATSHTVRVGGGAAPRQEQGAAMKFAWTRKKSRPDGDTDEEDRASALRRYSSLRLQPQPPSVPFNPVTCTLLQQRATADQAAFAAFKASCAGPGELWARAPVADWMLETLRRQWHWIPVAPERELRTFAWRCVQPLQGVTNPGLLELRRAVQARIHGHPPVQALEALQHSSRPRVAAVGVEGLRRCLPSAAGALALWHAATPDMYEAAFLAADFAALHDAFVELSEHAEAWTWPGDAGEPWRASLKTAFFSHAHPAVRATAMMNARKRQAGLLRELLVDPFAGSPARARAWCKDGLLFCRRCGPSRENAVREDVFDIRFKSCGWCGASLVQHH